MAESDERVTACEDGSFCCGIGPGALSCCNQGRGFRIVTGAAISKYPSQPPENHPSSSLSWSTQSLASPTTSPAIRPHNSQISQLSSPISSALTSSPSPSTHSPPSFGTGPLVSVILGGVFLAFILVSTGIYILRRRRRRRRLYHQHQKRHRQGDNSVGDSIVVLDVDGSTPSAPMEMRSVAEAPEMEIEGRVRPPERERREMVLPGVVWVDRLGNAVMQMGF
ncbi:MAG: hypothetical protein LQ338_001204 [Usnochroma carphineum]|nr:MAG: hypothetical protein LQ338_001204 [Usnochroma carphineum]